ncbi:MAG TPA: 4Fe-4S binding protein [Deltaproteobacteria bacterium]|nr:4Fe-4S binding protein [Deltaproteobacteria bacterium]HOM30051.1 4Fe-4S binding protein [Deltaproteobacteria bacterium]HPP80089.1 4Fe-4S binding protein [Deltaproteobacteria bacterium]
MGDIDKKTLYENLARHLHQGVIGAPLSPSLLKILEIMFTEEEAEVALRLPFENKTLGEIERLIPDKAPRLENILSAMAKNGTVFTLQKPGKKRVYRLLPTVVGFAEAPFWPGVPSEKARKLAPLWIQYRNEGFGEELSRNIPAVRVIPIDRSLRNSSEILPFDRIREKMKTVKYFAVSKCPCRQMMAYEGKGCSHSLENCLHFNDMGRYVVEQGMGREISMEEAVRILEEADGEGLVHTVENLDGFMSMICNCCGCCCVFLQTQKKMNLRMISSSNYVSKVDSESCAGCGTCCRRCPMDAVAVDDSGTAKVDAERCIGCGVCAPTCPTGAIALVLRQDVSAPPDVGEFLAKRYLAPAG